MPNPYHLSKRELEVAELLLQGKSNKQIALALGISEHTVEFHLKNIYAKLKVGSRAEAILKLGKSIGQLAAGNPGDSVVAPGGVTGDNRDDLVARRLETMGKAEKNGLQTVARFLGKAKFLLAFIVVLVFVLIYWLSQPSAWESYTRECEQPDVASVGQTIWRSNASRSQVHGQFGAALNDPWPAQSGYVIYKNISLPRIDQAFLKLRYSKNSPASAPILIYLDDEPAPRASVLPVDQQDWDLFTWTEPIYLGRIESGVHAIKLFTEGQQYGVADLDQLVLSKKSQ